MPGEFRLSIADQAPVRLGETARHALLECVELAVLAEELGYERYWVAEHHGLGLASTSPEVLVGQIAARTQQIRVGSGGVMLTHYSAFKVAENFRMLESFYPGRIDLGLGRAPGGDMKTARALAYPGSLRDVQHYPEQIDDLIAFLSDALPPDHRFAGVSAGPPVDTQPEVWLLGSGVDSAVMAAERGLPFSFAHFFGSTSEYAPGVCEVYRKRFKASAHLDAPKAHVALQVLCAESEAEAWDLANSLLFLRLMAAKQERRLGLTPPDEAKAYAYAPEERAFVEQSKASMVVGTPDQVRAQIEQIADACGTREVGIVSICYDRAARQRSYKLVAEAFGIAPQET